MAVEILLENSTDQIKMWNTRKERKNDVFILDFGQDSFQGYSNFAVAQKQLNVEQTLIVVQRCFATSVKSSFLFKD